jgi:iron complex outermembrane receptor protein
MNIRRKTPVMAATFMAACLGSSALTPTFALAASAAQQNVQDFSIAPQPLQSALLEFSKQSQSPVVASTSLISGVTAPAVEGRMDEAQALNALLAGSGLYALRGSDGGWAISRKVAADPQSGSAAGGGAEVEGLIVTAQKREENIQDVPIAMSAFSQETLTERQVAGGPDLITQIPNMSFTKTNFTSYSIQIRGIGTQAISATTDPAVAVAFNNTPFIRNRFFEQEFFDLERLEVLRGPQGTLYGRNATAGVVNLISAKPKFHYEAKASADIGNYGSHRLEGMVNIPLVEDVVALRLAGAMTKRDGYAFNQLTGAQIDGRDLWSTRLSLRFEPADWISANLIWEHFQEDDDRLRSGKQLCKRNVVTHIGTLPIPPGAGGGAQGLRSYISQGCEAVSLYSSEAFQTPDGFSLPYYGPTADVGNAVFMNKDPYLNEIQSRDLRTIESSVEPDYRAQSDIAELQIAIDISDHLTLNSETSYSADALFSLQDYNRFAAAPNAWNNSSSSIPVGLLDENSVFCDPQLGCSDRLMLVDLSTSDSTQFSQEFRLGSDFDGPINFSLGVNYLRHDALDKYYVFINSLSLWAGRNYLAAGYTPGVSDGSHCIGTADATFDAPGAVGDTARYYDPTATYSVYGCWYMDPNPIGALNDQGRNYFLSQNPYRLISYAAFGEIYYEITPSLKLTGGLRWTVDKKAAPQIPSWLLAAQTAGPYPTSQTIYQEWREPTGRLALDWHPELGFTDDTLVYASYAHGYKAGGANPPPPVFAVYGQTAGGDTPAVEMLPDTFGPEFVDAFELGMKNTLLGGAVTLNLTGFYYDYKGYQTSEIRNRAAVNSNFDAEVWGAEVEADWRVTEALRLGFKGGYNGTRMADGSSAIDLMDRTAGDPDWIVVRPFPSVPSNCIIPVFVATAGGQDHLKPAIGSTNSNTSSSGICIDAYYKGLDPVTGRAYNPSITDYTTAPNAPGRTGVLGSAYADYHGWDPATAPNGGRGFSKDLSGNELPNAPNYTATVTADYTVPLRGEWLVTFHGDYHYQSESWGRVINSDPYDRINAFSTVNVAGIFANEDAGWKVMTYVKNVFDETAITGTFLNSDDTGLTTNVFLTEPRLYGIRVTKDFTGGGWLGDFGGRRDGSYPFTVEIGGGTNQFSAQDEDYAPAWLDEYAQDFPFPSIQDEDLDWGDTREVKLTYAPSQDWRVSAAYRFGKTNSDTVRGAGYEAVTGGLQEDVCFDPFGTVCAPIGSIIVSYVASPDNHWRGAASGSEEHTIIDFMVGRETGFGSWGQGGKSMLALGLRHVELNSTARMAMDGVPDRFVPDFYGVNILTGPQPHRTLYRTTLDSERGFEGVGPSVSWETSARLFGDDESGHVDLDWTVTGGVLFGKQTADSSEDRFARYYISIAERIPTVTLYDDVVPRHRADDVTVPNLSLSLGLSYSIDRVKVSTGYSYDRFFDAIDGGYTESQTFDRTIHGPYLKLSLGFGG